MFNRRHLLTTIGLAALGGSASAGVMDWYNGVRIGMPLPEHDAKYLNAPPSTGGRLMLIDFWATWCGPCREGIPALNAWHERYRSQGLVVVGLTKEKPEVVLPFMAKVPMKYAVGAGMAKPLQDSIGVKAIPYAVFVDQAGKIIWRGQPGDINEAMIESLLKKAA